MKKLVITFLLGIAIGVVSAAEDFATEMVHSTFKLFHEDSTGTCFLVRRESPDKALYVVTAAHVLERMKGNTAIVVLRKPLPDGSYERHDHTVTIRRDDKPLWDRHATEDAAVLRLTEPPPFAVGSLPLSAIADERSMSAAKLHICSPLYVLTYPQRFEGNKAGFPVARQSIIASHPFLPISKYPTYLTDFTTFSGDSGGPVFMADTPNRPLVVGMVLAQSRHDEHVTTEYEKRTIHHPLGLGTVLHTQFIRDMIEKIANQDRKHADKPDGRSEQE